MQVVCMERRGAILRQVCEAAHTPEILWGLFDRLKGVPNFLSGKKQLESLSAGILFDPLSKILLVDDVGAVLSIYDPRFHTAHVHVTFWDRRLRGREELCRKIALGLMLTYEVTWLYTKIPKESGMIRAFAKRVGFEMLGDEETFVIAQSRIIDN